MCELFSAICTYNFTLPKVTEKIQNTVRNNEIGVVFYIFYFTTLPNNMSMLL